MSVDLAISHILSRILEYGERRNVSSGFVNVIFATKMEIGLNTAFFPLVQAYKINYKQKVFGVLAEDLPDYRLDHIREGIENNDPNNVIHIAVRDGVSYQFIVRANSLNMMLVVDKVEALYELPIILAYIASLNMLLAKEAKLDCGTISIMIGESYLGDFDNAREFVRRTYENDYGGIHYTIEDGASVDNFNKNTIQLLGYKPSKEMKQ